MRRSTLIAFAIIVVGMGVLLYAMKVYTDQFTEEIRRAKEVSLQVAHRLEPETRVKLAWVAGQSRYVVTDPDRRGLLLEARPRREEWEKDPAADAFSRDLARRLLAVYGPDRPVTWIEFRLTRPDGTEAPRFALEPAPDGTLRRTGGSGRP